ncbi:hypothetical protein Tco_0251528 [Tanacetum coccineum]
MKDVFETTESELDELEKQNDLLKDQLLEASLKHDVELCVLLNHECIDKILNAELQQVKKKSFEIQEGLQARIKILEKDLEKLENENVSLDFKVQSLIKERDNVKLEYQKLFDSIKKTRSQTQKEMDELIVHVSEKTYAYGAIRAENQNLLFTISELKTRLEKVKKVSKSKIDVESTSKAKDKVSSASRIKKRNFRDKPLNTFIKNKIRTSRIWQKWFESQPNVIWTPISVVQIVLWVVDSGCSKHMMGDRSLLRNFIEKFIGTVHFGNDNFAAIISYGHYIHGNITICHVYYVEGDDLLTGGRESNLYTISISDMVASLPVCLMSKATSTKSWLWHRRLSRLKLWNHKRSYQLDWLTSTKFKYGKDRLCSVLCKGKSKKASHSDAT